MPIKRTRRILKKKRTRRGGGNLKVFATPQDAIFPSTVPVVTTTTNGLRPGWEKMVENVRKLTRDRNTRTDAIFKFYNDVIKPVHQTLLDTPDNDDRIRITCTQKEKELLQYLYKKYKNDTNYDLGNDYEALQRIELEYTQR